MRTDAMKKADYERYLAQKKRKELIQAVLAFIGVFIMIALMFNAILACINMPDVEYSWSTKQCVRVVNMDGTEGDCNKLPEKFNHVWVQ